VCGERNRDICFVFPGLLEAGTRRGGGREERCLQIAFRLSRYFSIALLAPSWHYPRCMHLNEHLVVKGLRFPAVKNYPLISDIDKIVTSLSIIFYSLLACINIICLKKECLKVIVITDLFSGFLPALVARILRLKVIFYEGNLTPWVSPWLYPTNTNVIRIAFSSFRIVVGRVICSLSTKIVANSGLIKKSMEHYGTSAKKIVIIRGGVDTNAFKPSSPLSILPGRINVGFIGRLEDEKGALLLLEICKRAIVELPEARFFIFGDGTYRSNFEHLPNVEHVGNVTRSTLNQRLVQVQVVLFFQKDLGLAEYETMASGKAVIACNVGEVPKILQNHKNALLCKPNVNAYLQAISRVIHDHSLLNKLSTNARETTIRHFDWQVISLQWQSMIKNLLAK